MPKYEQLDTARETAYHEAGHMVAGLGVGCQPLEVYILPDMSGGVDWLHRVGGQSIAQVRRELVHVVAGPVAEFLCEARESFHSRQRWADRLDPAEWEASYRLVSARMGRGEVGGDGDDLSEAGHYATESCRRLKLQTQGRWSERSVRGDPLRLRAPAAMYWCHAGAPPEVSRAEVLAEVVRAERWAERVLSRRWQAVEAVAEALYASEEGRLSCEDVTAVLVGKW